LIVTLTFDRVRILRQGSNSALMGDCIGRHDRFVPLNLGVGEHGSVLFGQATILQEQINAVQRSWEMAALELAVGAESVAADDVAFVSLLLRHTPQWLFAGYGSAAVRKVMALVAWRERR
jgi:hypothetical protein